MKEHTREAIAIIVQGAIIVTGMVLFYKLFKI